MSKNIDIESVSMGDLPIVRLIPKGPIREEHPVNILLDKNRVKSVYHSHVSMGQTKGCYSFKRTDLDKFMDEYSDAIKEGKSLGIAERLKNTCPVIVDLDLKVKAENIGDMTQSHLYTEDELKTVVSIYQSVLREIVDECTDKNLMCVVLEKDIYSLSNEEGEITYFKNGFHLHFPNLYLEKCYQQIHLNPRIKKALTTYKLFERYSIGDGGSVIDDITTKPWLMYGSHKHRMQPYIATKVILGDETETTIEDAFDGYELIDTYSKQIQVTKENCRYYLPRILSTDPQYKSPDVIMELKPNTQLPIEDINRIQQFKNQIKNNNSKKQILNINVQESLLISEKLLPMLSESRAESRDDWITIGWALFNIGKGCDQALEQWLKFSQRCVEKYSEETCRYEWANMTYKNLTLGTIHYYASIDSPDEYKKFKNDRCGDIIENSIRDGAHCDIASVLYELYRNEFVCSSISNRAWYMFDGVKWKEIEEGTELSKRISREVVNKYNDKKRQLLMRQADTVKDVEDEELDNGPSLDVRDHEDVQQKLFNNKIKQIDRVTKNLRTVPFKKNVMQASAELFYDERFKQKLNQDRMLICFRNGVYDLKQDRFRDGRPEDFISKCLPIDYIEFDESSDEVQNVKNFLEQIFTNDNIRIYFLDKYSDIFDGGYGHKKIYFWTGDGHNGKSILQLMFEKMLGELAIKFNSQVLTGKKVSNGSANPEMSRAAPPVRWVGIDEPDQNEQLNTGLIKLFTGGDSFWARDLFEKGKNVKEVIAHFMMTLICNKLPKVHLGGEQGWWNRPRVIPFESKFVEPQKVPDTYEEQKRLKLFPKDPHFSEKIPSMVEAFAWYLLEWRKTKKIKAEPEEVMEATRFYQKQNDMYRQFIEERIDTDANTSVSLTDIYIDFKEWYREGWTGNVPNKNDVKEYFENVWGNCIRGKWSGYKIRTYDDDINDGRILDVSVLGDVVIESEDEKSDEEYTVVFPEDE